MMLLGPTMDPKVASDLALRLPHLGLRVREHSRRWGRLGDIQRCGLTCYQLPDVSDCRVPPVTQHT